MKLYEIIVRPLSGFGTPLKGDTIFGQFCWQVCHDESLVHEGLEKSLETYDDKPFAIFSSAYPYLGGNERRFALRRPDLPLSMVLKSQQMTDFDRARAAKENKRRSWMLVGPDLAVQPGDSELIDDQELTERIIEGLSSEERRRTHTLAPTGFTFQFSQPHNSINRTTWTTGRGDFAPYTMDSVYFHPGTRLVIFVLVEEEMTDIDCVIKGLSRIGQTGFGRDASIGLGRFSVESFTEINPTKPKNVNACYCLAPCVPVPGSVKTPFFRVFVRFGKHGDVLGQHRLPFKNPVIMADEGAVFIPTDPTHLERPYFGSAVRGISKIQPAAVAQGYSVCLPVRVEV